MSPSLLEHASSSTPSDVVPLGPEAVLTEIRRKIGTLTTHTTRPDPPSLSNHSLKRTRKTVTLRSVKGSPTGRNPTQLTGMLQPKETTSKRPLVASEPDERPRSLMSRDGNGLKT